MLSWKEVKYFEPLLVAFVLTFIYIILNLFFYSLSLYYQNIKDSLKDKIVKKSTRKKYEDYIKLKELENQVQILSRQKSYEEKILKEANKINHDTEDLYIKNKGYII